MKRCLIECLAGLLLCSLVCSSLQAEDAPLQILVITDGCCHDYGYQTESMQKALKRADVAAEWTIVAEGGKGTQAEIKFYDDPDWAKGFDVVIHNECFANTDNPEYIRKITDAHKAGVNAVVIHCAMHTYRAAKIDDWREFLGVTSRRHEHKAEYLVRVVAEKHPVMQGFPADWKTPKDELYVIEKVWPKTTVLASSISEKSGKLHPVLWTSQYGKARVFGTTYGHSNETFDDPVFLNVLTRGIQWAAGRLEK
jgi:type 1 glutamine amidotransferase